MTLTTVMPTRHLTHDRHAAPLPSRIEILQRALDHAFPLRVLETLLDRMEQSA